MRLKEIVCILVITLGFFKSYGQLKLSEVDKFYGIVWKNLKTKKNFKDSLAFYTCNLQIKLSKANNYKPTITSNDTSVLNRLENIEVLKAFNYKNMIADMDDVILILPVGIVILNSAPGLKSVNVYELKKIMKMFYHPKPAQENKNVFYLTPYLAFDDRIKYD